MKHTELKKYLEKVIKIDKEAVVKYIIDDKDIPINKKYNITDLFTNNGQEEDYYDLFIDTGFGEEQTEQPISAEKLLEDLKALEIERGNDFVDPDISLIIGNEDGTFFNTNEREQTLDANSRYFIFEDRNNYYIPHKKDVTQTALNIFQDNLTNWTEENRENFSIKLIIEETIEDMRNDFSENAGDELSIQEQESMQMFEYTEIELKEASKYLQDKFRYKEPINGVSYHSETSREVISVLETARKNKTRIRIDLGFTKTHDDVLSGKQKQGQSWGEEYDIEGTVGNSNGDIKIPLLIARTDSLGGGGILDDCIVCIRTSTGELLYRDENYMPIFDWENATVRVNKENDYPFSIVGFNNKEQKENDTWVSFKTKSEADRYLKKKRKFEIPKVEKKIRQTTNTTSNDSSIKKGQ